MDETSWGLVPHDEKVWTVTGAEEVILDISQNYPSKSRFTCIATINSYGQKLPLITVAKGNAVRCESSFRKVLGNKVTHTPNGWSTECLMLAYIQWISQRSNSQPICLIWDRNKSFCTQRVKDFAQSLHVEIIYVPAGQTGTEQSLDRLVFGGMKKTADRLWNQKFMAGEKSLYTKETACIIMLESWKLIKEPTIKKAWNHFYTKNEDEIKEASVDQDWMASEDEEEDI